MNVIETKLSGLKIIEPKVFGDNRGFFFESYQLERYQKNGIDVKFVQDNVSRSHYGVLRGLHYQLQFPQDKLVTVIRGAVFDVAVDIRVGSQTFGQWFGAILSDENHRQMYIPKGFAHGFCVLSEFADFHYKCSDYYHSEDEHGIIWNDKKIAIAWPKLDVAPILSTKDLTYLTLAEISANQLPRERT
jgi:dTDP-4-dehydrorhamnose 3,5-epimerase